jgi:hypothetical protein
MMLVFVSIRVHASDFLKVATTITHSMYDERDQTVNYRCTAVLHKHCTAHTCAVQCGNTQLLGASHLQ